MSHWLDTPACSKAARLRLLALDVDGVLSDGRLLYTSDHQEIKAFHVHDGVGIKALQRLGIQVAIITGRRSPMVERRCNELGIDHLIMGRDDKWAALQELTRQLGIDITETGYCGDDLPDLEAIHRAGLGASVPNAPDYIQQAADMVTTRRGGQGAVRELCEFIINAQGRWNEVLTHYHVEDAASIPPGTTSSQYMGE
ncbi:KdsC family phosphatase [Larsenimonas rhizosphaerae]|uniref:3-deoxy-D-manno-octulosonate 8-phosphate phosphatase KdsC n=1 Tax=Larsenimonas rhizosphaerae TaxID=2944682 RepID=A0AA41ZL51_9GAMM|nr:HAD-IIIA family hydrolase [Larsenimonas rhizosphaerae]MCX2523783.1 HAD-IIIA family hydrolase [Larsenimonas rhizosphaerae]